MAEDMIQSSYEDKDVVNQLRELFLMDKLEGLQKKLDIFNVFSVLKITHAELRHSNVLSWLLDPYENHGMGSSFLEKFLKRLKHQHPDSAFPLDLRSSNFNDVVVRREWKHIDILVIINCNGKKVVIVIENKVRSGEQKSDGEKIGQLGRYDEVVKKEFNPNEIIRVFLTRFGEDPSLEHKEAWNTIDYKTIMDIIESLLLHNADGINSQVHQFLDQYIKKLKEITMEINDELVLLVNDINHKYKKALDYIYATRNDDVLQLLAESKELIEKSISGAIISQKGKNLGFVTPGLIRYQELHDTEGLLTFSIDIKPEKISLHLTILPNENKELRNQVHADFKANKTIFAQAGKESITPMWTTVLSIILVDKKVFSNEQTLEEIVSRLRTNWSKFITDKYPAIEDFFNHKADTCPR